MGMAPAEIDILAPQKTFPGDRPSTTILLDRLDPQTLGALIALYEHKTFVEGVIWRINSFDQWGVELGKTLAGRVLGELEGGASGDHDPSTTTMIGRLKAGASPATRRARLAASRALRGQGAVKL